MSFRSPMKVNLSACEALGIAPDCVSKLVVTFAPDEIPKAEVTYLIFDKRCDEFVETLRRFEILEVE